MSDYHPNLDGPSEPYGLSIDSDGNPLSPPAPGSAQVHPRYHEAYQPTPGEQISEHAECPACGHTSADFGRWRKAETHEEADADGEIYECGYCGETRIIPPLPNHQGMPRPVRAVGMSGWFANFSP